MIRKAGIILTVFATLALPGSFASAQLLQYTDGRAPDNVAYVTVGTTTQEVTFTQARLTDIQGQLKSMLRYLEQLDQTQQTLDVAALIASTTPQVQNIYSQIANYVFDATLEQQQAQQQQIETALTEFAETFAKFAKSFDIGSRDPEVKEVQRFLNRFPETRIAESGPGSPGQETDYFGALTAQVVKRFQEKYAEEILKPVGLTNATGYWGAATRAYANELLDR